jgi:hypothetical protein
MKIVGSVFCALIFTACAIPATAQSATPQAPARDYLAPHDSREQLPALKLSVQSAKPATIPNRPAKIAGNSTVCYAIRSYNYGPVDSLTEAPKPTGSSTCTQAADSHLKGAAVLLR